MNGIRGTGGSALDLSLKEALKANGSSKPTGQVLQDISNIMDSGPIHMKTNRTRCNTRLNATKETVGCSTKR